MFDDLEDVLGIKLKPQQKLALKELARRKNDTLRVYNPLPKDYYVGWGLYDQVEPGGWFKIPGKTVDVSFGMGMSNQPRYIATKFFKEAALMILQSEQRHAINKENLRRTSNGFAKLKRQVDEDEESNFLMSEGLIINQEKYLALLPKIILGVVHEWGLDVKPMQNFAKELTLEDLQSITDREVGTDADPMLVGTRKINDMDDSLVENPANQPKNPQNVPQPTPQVTESATNPSTPDPVDQVAA